MRPVVRDASECGARWVRVVTALVLALALEAGARRVVQVPLVGVGPPLEVEPPLEMESPLEVEPPLEVRLRVEELALSGGEMRKRQGRGVSSRR